MKRINIYTVELVRESAKLYDLESAYVRMPEDAYRIIEKTLSLSTKTKEHFVMLTLNTKNKVVGVHTIHIGSVNASIISPRDVYQQALLNNATSIIVAHNHPSGSVHPSSEDIEVTKRLREAGKVLGIDFLDHLIIGDNDYKSLSEEGI